MGIKPGIQQRRKGPDLSTTNTLNFEVRMMDACSEPSQNISQQKVTLSFSPETTFSCKLPLFHRISVFGPL